MGVMALVALATAALNGFGFQPRTQFTTMLWCMPFLLCYLLAVGASTRMFADKMRAQKRALEQARASMRRPGWRRGRSGWRWSWPSCGDSTATARCRRC